MKVAVPEDHSGRHDQFAVDGLRIAERHAQADRATDRHGGAARHAEREIVRVVLPACVVRSGEDRSRDVVIALRKLAHVLVRELEVVHGEHEFSDFEIRIHRHVEAFEVAVADDQAWRDETRDFVGVAERYAQASCAADRYKGGACHAELEVGGVITPAGVVHAGVDGSRDVVRAGRDLAHVLVGELQVIHAERNISHREVGVDRHINRFQIAVDQDQAGRFFPRGRVRVAEGHTQTAHAAHRHIAGARHGELEPRCVVRLGGVVRPGVDDSRRACRARGNLAGVLVGELEVFHAKLNIANLEARIDRQIEGFQLAIHDDQAGRRRRHAVDGVRVAHGDAQVGHAADRHEGSARHVELILGGAVAAAVGACVDTRSRVAAAGNLAEVLIGEVQIPGAEGNASDSEARIDREAEAYQVAAHDGQAGHRGAVGVRIAKGRPEAVRTAHRNPCGSTERVGLRRLGVGESQARGVETDLPDRDRRIDRHVEVDEAAVLDHEAGAGDATVRVAKYHVHVSDAPHRGDGAASQGELVCRRLVGEPQAVGGESDAGHADIRRERHVERGEAAVGDHQACRARVAIRSRRAEGRRHRAEPLRREARGSRHCEDVVGILQIPGESQMIRTEAQGPHRDRRRHDHVDRRQVAVGDHQPGRGCRPKVGVGAAEGDADILRVEAEAARTGEREGGRLGRVDKVEPGRVERQSASRDV